MAATSLMSLECSALASVLLFAASPAGALQVDSTAIIHVETRGQERWLHARQQPRFTPFTRLNKWTHIDSIATDAAGAVHIQLRLGEGTLRAPGVVTFLNGTLQAARFDTQPSSPFPDLHGLGPFEVSRWTFEGRFELPEAGVWDLVPSFRPERATPGARWVDTVRFSAEHDGHRQAVRGTRVSIILRDTTINGRAFWLVRDSTLLSYEERQLLYERTLAALVTQESHASGSITGLRIQDTTTKLPVTTIDTVQLEGVAELLYPDGRSFRTSARYERFRRRDLYNADNYTARMAALSAEYETRHSGGMLFYNEAGSVEERVRTGDLATRDSLLAVVRSTQDPMERARVYGQLRSGSVESALLDAAALEAGDTAWLAQQYTHRLFVRSQPNDTASIRFLLPFLSDPGIAFAFRLDRDPFYENLRDPLLYRPPAVARGPAERGCAPVVCTLLVSFADSAREPRLRDLGLLAGLATDPARWADAVRQRADSSLMLSLAAPLLDGAPIFTPGSAGASIPVAGAPWREWLEWVTSRGRIADSLGATLDMPRSVHAEDAHRVAIHFTELLTRRPVQQELRAAFDTASVDSARLVFGALLLALGDWRTEPNDLARRFLEGSHAERELAHRELYLLMRDAPLADSATTIELLNVLLEWRVNGAELWPHLDPATEQQMDRIQSTDTIPLFIHAEDLPGSLRQLWADRIGVFDDEPPDRRTAHEVLKLEQVRQIGPFAVVEISSSTWDNRRPEQAPAGFASGTTFYLLRTETGWKIVATGGWIT